VLTRSNNAAPDGAAEIASAKSSATTLEDLRLRTVPLEMQPEEFRALGHRTVDRIADFLLTLRQRPVAPAETPAAVRAALGGGGLPERGSDAGALLEEAASLVIEHSLLNGHPRFWAYITSSAAPIGALGDLLAAAVNPNLGGWDLSPMASEVEAQTVRWIAELIGYPTTAGGLLVSGGNMANFVCFLAARRARAGWDVRDSGLAAGPPLRLYASAETHTWVQKAADLYGLGTDAIRWIPVDAQRRMDMPALAEAVAQDEAAGARPFLVVGTAGTVSTGAIDPLPEIAAFCRQKGLWFHVDGAYGGFAAALPGAPADLKALALADSVAVDPHKWLYAPLEAGCALVRERQALLDAFSYHPAYYQYSAHEEETSNFHELGPQNSRGFRALKVWLGLRQAGRQGAVRMMEDDVRLAEELFRLVGQEPELEPATLGLSITTFRFVPLDLRGTASAEPYLNELNTALMERLRASGQAWLSNAVVNERFLLRTCIVNFRTTLEDIQALPPLAVALGRELDVELRAG